MPRTRAMVVDNIRKLCKEHGLSVSGLERELGFGNSTISKWEKSSPSVDKLRAVSGYFGCTIDELLREE